MDFSLDNAKFRESTSKRQNSMEINGMGAVKAAPDIALVSVGVITSGRELEAVQLENAIITQGVISQLKEQGIKDEDIQTQSYNIETIYDYKDGKQIFKEYRVTNILRVTIREIIKTGAVIDTAVTSGANFVGSIEFTLSETSRYYRRALEKALADAVQKAEAIACTLNVRLERTPLRIIEESYVFTPPGMMTQVKSFAADTTPIQPGQLQIKANIKAIFIYK